MLVALFFCFVLFDLFLGYLLFFAADNYCFYFMFLGDQRIFFVFPSKTRYASVKKLNDTNHITQYDDIL